MGQLKPEDWKARCAAQFVRRADVPQDHAEDMAEECFKLCEEDGGYSDHDPEDSADLEMSYWDFD